MIPKDSRLWRVKYLQEYLDITEEHNIPSESCCMCGSVSLAVFGIRENQDIDFICSREFAKSRDFKGDHTYFLGDGRKVALIPTAPPYFPKAFHGMTFMDGHHVVIDGLKVATVEDSYLFKCAWLFHGLAASSAKAKDAEDVKLMNQYFERHGFDESVLPEEIWDGGEIWRVGTISVKLPSPYRLKAYNPMEVQPL